MGWEKFVILIPPPPPPPPHLSSNLSSNSFTHNSLDNLYRSLNGSVSPARAYRKSFTPLLTRLSPALPPLLAVLILAACPAPVTPDIEPPASVLPAGMSYAATTLVARGSSTSVSVSGAQDVTAAYAFDTSESNPAPPSWLTVDASTGTVSAGSDTVKVPADAPAVTTTYKIKVTGTGRYAGVPDKILDFRLTVRIADFPDPLGITVTGMILNASKKSGSSTVTDANTPDLTVTYSYSPLNTGGTAGKPSWLTVNSSTREITVTDIPDSDLPGIGAKKTYKIRVTGTGIYEDRTADIDFVISGSVVALPTNLTYGGTTTVKKGDSNTVPLTNPSGVTAAYAFNTESPNPAPPSWLTIDPAAGAVQVGTAANTVPGNADVGTKTYKVDVTGTGIYENETTQLDFVLEVIPRPLPSLTYTALTVSKGGSSTERTISVDISGGLTANDAAFAFEPASSKPTWLNIGNTGTISGEVPIAASAGSTTYTIKVTGKDIYSDNTKVVSENVPFTLVITTDACTDALRVNCDRFEEAYVKAPNTQMDDQFGYSVSLSGDTLAVGAYREDSSELGGLNDNSRTDSGAVYVFTRSGTTWSRQAFLKPTLSSEGDQFGWSVSLSGDTLAVGARWEDSASLGINGNVGNSGAPDAGAVYVFIRNSEGRWSQQAYVKASNPSRQDYFGHSVSLSGDTLAVGAIGEDSNSDGFRGLGISRDESGAVYVFTRSGTTWSQQAYLKAPHTDSYDYFGRSVSLSGDTLAVGAVGEDGNATDDPSNNDVGGSGAVYVFTRSGTTWSLQDYLKAASPASEDRFGESVSLSGDTLAVGAYWESRDATGGPGDNTTYRSGAVYVFTRAGTAWSRQAYLKASTIGANDEFGWSVSLSGDTLAVGAKLEDSAATGVGGGQRDNNARDSGAVYVFTRSGGTWSHQAYLKASNTNDYDHFGHSLSLLGDTLAVGAYQEDSNATGIGGDQTNNSARDSGAVYIRRIAP